MKSQEAVAGSLAESEQAQLPGNPETAGANASEPAPEVTVNVEPVAAATPETPEPEPDPNSSPASIVTLESVAPQVELLAQRFQAAATLLKSHAASASNPRAIRLIVVDLEAAVRDLRAVGQPEPVPSGE